MLMIVGHRLYIIVLAPLYVCNVPVTANPQVPPWADSGESDI